MLVDTYSPDIAYPNLDIRDKYMSEIAKLRERAKTSPRLRSNLSLGHETRGKETFHRMLNAIEPGSYMKPHMHPDKNMVEFFQCLYGEVYVISYNSDGNISKISDLIGSESKSVEVGPGVYHSVLAVQPSVIYEENRQPKGRFFDSKLDRVDSDWSPNEDQKGETSAFMSNLLSHAQSWLREHTP